MVIGVIGSSVLLYCHVDLGEIDITSATFAGLAGGIAFAVFRLPILSIAHISHYFVDLVSDNEGC